MPETKTNPAHSNHPGSSYSLRSLVQSGWIYPLLACFILILLFSAKRIGSYDLGTHLRAGQWIVENHAFPSKDTFTYTQAYRDYLDSNGLYQIFLYLLQKFLGYPALSLMNMAVISFVFVFLLARLKLSNASPWAACFWLLLAALVMERRFMVRPEVFSWLLLSLTLIVLKLRVRNRDYLHFLPLIQFLWVNIEGLFVLGWIAIGAYVLSGWFHQKRWDKKLVKFGLLSVAADLLNPYFFKGVFFPFMLLTRLQGSNLHAQTITELHSPLEYLKTQNLHYDLNAHIFLFMALAGLGALAILLTLRRRKLHEILLAATFGFLACAAVRNIPLFVIACAPVLYQAARDLIPIWITPMMERKGISLAVAFAILLFCLRVATNAYYISDRRLDRLGLGLDPGRLPVKAVDFLVQNHLNGRILNHLDFGGWLDWQGPQQSFIDGRSEVMEDDFYRQYVQSFSGTGLMDLFIPYQPQLILMEYNSSISWIEQLRHFPDWRLIYLDECAALYARRDYAKDIPALSYPFLQTERRIPVETDEDLLQLVQANSSSPFSMWLNGFFHPKTYPMGLFGMGLFALKIGEYSTARNFFAEGLRQTGGDYDEVFFNLGVANLHLKKYSLGKACLEEALRLNPNNPSALQMLESLKGY